MNNIVGRIAEINPEAIILPEYNEAIIGIDSNKLRVVYSTDKIIEILMRDNNMTHEEALDDFGYNTLCFYAGENTPVFVDTIDE